jgi:hypothetical protein
MKKSILLLGVLVCLSLFLSACSNSSEESLQEEISILKKENELLKANDKKQIQLFDSVKTENSTTESVETKENDFQKEIQFVTEFLKAFNSYKTTDDRLEQIKDYVSSDLFNKYDTSGLSDESKSDNYVDVVSELDSSSVLGVSKNGEKIMAYAKIKTIYTVKDALPIINNYFVELEIEENSSEELKVVNQNIYVIEDTQ